MFFWAGWVPRVAAALVLCCSVVTGLIVAVGGVLGPLLTTDYLEIAYMVEERPGGDWDIALLDVGRQLSSVIIHSDANERYPAWSPDGTRLIYHADHDITYDLYMWDSRTRRSHRLYHPKIFGYGHEAMAAWSPDGEHILFHANVSGSYHIFISDAEGYSPREVFPLGEETLYADWSPDGTKIAFSMNTGLFTLDVDENFYRSDAISNAANKFTVLEGEDIGWYPDWSPDSEQIVFVGDAQNDLYVINADGSGLHNLTQTPTIIETEPVWLPDGRILFVSNWNWRNDLYVMDAEGRNITALTDSSANTQAPTVRPLPD